MRPLILKTSDIKLKFNFLISIFNVKPLKVYIPKFPTEGKLTFDGGKFDSGELHAKTGIFDY